MSSDPSELIHYGPGRLQTYTIWRPPPSPTSAPQSSTSTENPPLWILYVHGGAWRDPLQSSANILPTLQHLTSTTSSKPALADPTRLAAVVSIDYRLSPYPTHPTAPSTTSDDQRNVRHPSHVRDLASAVAHLKAEHGMQRWIGVGHSCGASMLLHYVSGQGLSPTSSSTGFSYPGFSLETRNNGLEGLILLEGIYDIPRLLANHSPPVCPAEIAGIYRTFVRGAFGSEGLRDGEDGGDGGDDGEAYAAFSPANGSFTRETWADGRLVVVAYSGEDELVEREQGEILLRRLKKEEWVENGKDGERVVEVKELRGTHDFMWRDGSQIAALIGEVVGRL
ncbi:unnamed protein product [Periconia digitata]|uniref:Uncharacterized protein n=1 Tax=Periconia digitata TaxID=1303443 RepID=A0A9W4XDS2_9PLEO|nr:unnamed protein product [Periconia digitata]